MKINTFLFVLIIWLLQACGQSGPLFLPGSDNQPVSVPPKQ
jgi:predicted small lipoprotein YifL